jgi:hypothetical protein
MPVNRYPIGGCLAIKRSLSASIQAAKKQDNNTAFQPESGRTAVVFWAESALARFSGK